MADKQNDEIEKPIIGETIPPDVEAPEADNAKDAGKANAEAFFASGAYAKLFEQAQGHFTKIADIAQEVFETLVAQGKKVEETLKEKMEETHATEKAKEFAEKAETQAKEFAKRAEEQTKKFREEYLSDEKIEGFKKNFADAFEPVNIFALNKQIEELKAKITDLEAENAALKGETPAAPSEEAATETAPKPKKRVTKKETPEA